MITVGDLRARDVLPTWQEAVAVVQELVHATGAVTSAVAAFPDIEHISLSPDGTVVVLPGSSVSGSPNPVRQLAVILELLLDGVPAPDQLKALVSRNVANPPEFQTVGEFAQAVTFFERPSRRSDIGALVERASAASERTRADEELRRLQAKALEASERSAKPEPEKDSTPRRRVHPFLLIGGLTVVVSLLTAAGTWYGLIGGTPNTNLILTDSRGGASKRAADPVSKPPASPPGDSSSGAPTGAPATEHTSLLSRLGKAVRSAAASFGLATPDTAVPASAPPAPKASVQRRRSRRPSDGVAPGDASVASQAAEPILIVTELGGYPLEPPSPDLAVDTTFGIYSGNDRDVQAPVMVRPVLPTAPPTDVPKNQLGTLELLVNERGQVEHVRLVSPFNRHQERMIVANAKTWKFTPATRGGRPVKYRSRGTADNLMLSDPESIPSPALAQSLREALLSARNDDGGWGYFGGKLSRLEPTTAALLALGLPGELTRVAERWPKKAAVIIEPGADTANYGANAQAAIVGLSTGTIPARWVLRLLEGLAIVEGRKTALGDPAINRQNNALRGWPWVDDTFSWAEPTAWCLLALKRGRHHVQPENARIDEGERLLIDRVCEPGGWNYGNSNVFRRNLPPYTPTTAIALLAMQGRDVPAVSRSLAFLKEHRLEERSGLALALTAICLGVYRQPAKDVLDALANQWARTRYLGNLYATALALYAITCADSGFEAFRV